MNIRGRISSPCRQRGLTLVEMMIALSLGLLVTSAVSAIVVNISTSASQSVVYTRATQDMRTLLSVMTRELRRAGYNSGAFDQIGTGITADLHSRLVIDTGDDVELGECIMFGYDTLDIDGIEDSTPGTISIADPTEWRGFRRQVIEGVGVVQMRIGGDGVGEACDDGGHQWVTLSDRQRIDVTELQFDMSRSYLAIGGSTPDPADPTSSVTVLVGVRPVIVTMRARIIGQDNSERELRQWVRIRAETTRLVAVASP